MPPEMRIRVCDQNLWHLNCTKSDLRLQLSHILLKKNETQLRVKFGTRLTSWMPLIPCGRGTQMTDCTVMYSNNFMPSAAVPFVKTFDCNNSPIKGSNKRTATCNICHLWCSNKGCSIAHISFNRHLKMHLERWVNWLCEPYVKINVIHPKNI